MGLENLLMNSAVIGTVLYVSDILIRPRFGNGPMQFLRIGLEGYAVVYAQQKMNSDSCSDIDVKFTEVLVMSLVIFITDMLLAIAYVGNIGTEILKFYLQGLIVSLIGSGMPYTSYSFGSSSSSN